MLHKPLDCKLKTMNTIKQLKLTKKADSPYMYYISGIIPDGITGGDLTLHGHEDSPPTKSINLFYPDYDVNEFIDFIDNEDEAGQEYAKTHQILYNANQVGKVSIRDGNFPPPYNNNKLTRLAAYNQNILSAAFFVKEIEFILQPTNKYMMNITLQKGNGGLLVVIPDRIKRKQIRDTGNYGILIGIEDGLGPDATLKFTASDLDLNKEIGLVIMRYANSEYDMTYSNPHLHKKGVIELR